MALQLALTTLESVAVMLNERKRESEQSAAFHAKLRNGGSKLVGAKAEAGARVLLREDDVQQLEFNSLGQVKKCNISVVLWVGQVTGQQDNKSYFSS